MLLVTKESAYLLKYSAEISYFERKSYWIVWVKYDKIIISGWTKMYNSDQMTLLFT